jgi:hypothetical protein
MFDQFYYHKNHKRGFYKMTDIIQKITKVAPSELDDFEADLTRRNALDSTQIDKILTSTFLSLRTEKLNPAQMWQYNQVFKRLQS